MRKPETICARCEYRAYDVAQANGRCPNHDAHGKRCKGTLKSAIGPDDWAVCGGCSGAGCPACLGSGWLFVRPR